MAPVGNPRGTVNHIIATAATGRSSLSPCKRSNPDQTSSPAKRLSPDQKSSPDKSISNNDANDIASTETALLSWMSTFGSADEVKMKNCWFTNYDFARCTRNATAEILGRDVSMISSSLIDADNIWKSIFEALELPVHSSLRNKREDRLVALKLLLRRSVANSCAWRNVYIGRIMNLKKNVQVALMQIIKDDSVLNNNSMLEDAIVNDLSYDDEIISRRYNDDLDDDSNLLSDGDESEKENSHHERYKATESKVTSPKTPVRHSTPVNIMASPPTTVKNALIAQLKKELGDLQEIYVKMENDIGVHRSRECELSSKLAERDAKQRALLMNIESAAMLREHEVQEEYKRKIATLEKEVKSYQTLAHEASLCKQEVASLKDEIDVLKHANEKASQAEEQVKRLKLKLEMLADVKECLKREEKAHSDSIANCVRLENELSALQPIRRQLDEYKMRVTETEVKLAEYEQELKMLRDDKMTLHMEKKVLIKGNLIQHEETEQLRRQLLLENDDIRMSSELATVGKELGELNPKLKVELVQLRNENDRLKKFLQNREHDEVQKLEQQIDDANRLVEKFREQFLSTKAALDNNVSKLKLSVTREEELTSKVLMLEQLRLALENDLKQNNISHQHEISRLNETFSSSKTMIMSEAAEAKKTLEKLWMSRLEDAEKNFEGQLRHAKEALTEMEKKSEDAINKMRENHEQAMLAQQSSLQAKIDELLKNKEDDHRTLIEKGKKMIKDLKTENCLKLNEMKGQFLEVEKLCDDRLNAVKKLHNDFANETKAKIESYQQMLQNSVMQEKYWSQKCESLEDKCNQLIREKSILEEEIDRQKRRRFASENGQAHVQYEMLQKEYQLILKENRQLKEHNASHRLPMPYEYPQTLTNDNLNGTTVSNSSLSELRAEYEEAIATLMDEKRELVMKTAAAMTDTSKAEHRSFELEKELERLSNELTSARLQIERLEKHQIEEEEREPVFKVVPYREVEPIGSEDKSSEKRVNKSYASKFSPQGSLKDQFLAKFSPTKKKTHRQAYSSSDWRTLGDYD